MNPLRRFLPCVFAISSCLAASPTRAAETAAVTPDRSPLYVSNRPPLTPTPFVRLPIGSITPKGWLRHQLELERDGMAGHLEEISPWLDFNTSAWANKDGEGKNEWEELPYWLKGFGDLGYVLKDEKIIAHARKWLDAIMAGQREDGYLGPRKLLIATEGKADLWPQMPVLNALQSFYEFTGDKRVIDVMTRYFHWQDNLPAEGFSVGYWARVRMGDNLESIYWLYNRTGDERLLGLAKKIFDSSARWDQDVINWHNVNIAQGFRTPTIYWMQDQRPDLLAGAERNYAKVMGIYGQFPGGGFAGDENCRAGFIDPRQGFETCGMVEFMHSFEMLTRITGQPVWSDRCEDIAFNSFPAAMTVDQKALHYLTSANSVQLDHNDKAPGIQNGGEMISYSPFEAYRCCQHNHTMGWPYYAEELWLATPDRGLCASLYSASEVKAKVGAGAGQEIAIEETTDYPFDESVTFKITAGGANFPLYLRIPHWCENAAVAINGEAQSGTPAKAGSYFKIAARAWKAGDTVTLRLPMKLSVRRWAKNKDSVSVDRGPLTFSLAIGTKTESYGRRNPEWPETDVYATTPWNYGLALEGGADPATQFEVVRKPGPLAVQPFTPETAPISLKAKARKIDAWTQDRKGLLMPLQPSPAKTAEPVETVSLIPMGAARLRITAFPTVSDKGDARVWAAPSPPPQYKASASHTHDSDSTDALCDGVVPPTSNEQSVPRFTWWDHRGSKEWVQYDFPKARKVSSASVFWFDDTGSGQCRVPQSWKLLHKDAAGAWKEISAGPNDYGAKRDVWNRAAFFPVETSAMRLEVQLQPEFSGGILEWKVE